MKCKDLSLESMQEVRGGLSIRGGNSISQKSSNGGVLGSVAVAGHGFNMSPVTVDSQVSQLNSTAQGAAISDIREHSFGVGVHASQIELGGWFGGWR